MTAIIQLIVTVIDFYKWIIIASVVMNLLVSFNIVQYTQPLVRSIYDFLFQLTEPVFAFVRRFLPAIGGIDLSPIVVLFGLQFLQTFIAVDVARMLLG